VLVLVVVLVLVLVLVVLVLVVGNNSLTRHWHGSWRRSLSGDRHHADGMLQPQRQQVQRALRQWSWPSGWSGRT